MTWKGYWSRLCKGNDFNGTGRSRKKQTELLRRWYSPRRIELGSRAAPMKRNRPLVLYLRFRRMVSRVIFGRYHSSCQRGFTAGSS
jgi:hypothetical protein